jgi:hypothetical protein
MIKNRKIEILLDETGTAFRMLNETGNSPNTDYADYAARTRIDCFRSALQNPDLSRWALAAILRNGFKSDRSLESKAAKATEWVTFLASHIQQSANSNAA